jgi:hypothetical protein
VPGAASHTCIQMMEEEAKIKEVSLSWSVSPCEDDSISKA